ncbi:hypothetical protein ACFOHU_15935 [Ottowia pentelensis]|uniref:Ribbon-helix-helix protein, CopG family n=1 Tax=Ottowia pentelensis TaxID=511108 RepID=A0ABV6PQT0_9BURK
MTRIKTTIRLLVGVNETLRERVRMHGDMASIIELAIHQADFTGMNIRQRRGRRHAGLEPLPWSAPTTVSIGEQAWQRLNVLTQETGLPRNTVINQALRLYLASTDPGQPDH